MLRGRVQIIDCHKLLEQSISGLATNTSVSDTPFSSLIDRAKKMLGNDLLAVIVFGSYVRNEATQSSDIDLLIVVDSSRKLDRSIYREWSSHEKQDNLISDLPVSVHFASLPASALGCSGLWLEISLEGIVIWDPTLTVNRFLVAIRKLIAQDLVDLRTSHGQRYWIWRKEAA